MGQVRVTGVRLHEALERALPVDFAAWPEGVQRYSLLLNERGGIEDDLMVTRLRDEVRIVVNAGCRDKDLALLRGLCPDLSFELLDRALIALQGPQAEAVLASLQAEVRALGFMRAGTFGDWLVSRSGYTGEDGFEISLPRQEAEQVARQLLANPAVKPVGLGARDTLRLEAGLHLYGQDMNERTTALEASLGWAIAPSRRAGGGKEGGFPGADVYLRQAREGIARRLVGLVGMDPAPIRHGAPIVDSANREAGVVTSGTVSPSTQRAIMLGYVGVKSFDKELFALVRDARRPVRITKLPFVPKRYKK
jgi:aminomethyltransferase